MAIWQKIKSTFAPQRYVRAAVGTLMGSPVSHIHPKPFDHSAATRRFSSWAYAAAMLNAQAVASVPLRLYVRRRSATRLFDTATLSRGCKQVSAS